MKNLNVSIIISLLFSTISNADNSYLGRAPDRGIIITAEPENPNSKSGDKFAIKGRIKVVGKLNSEENKGKKKDKEDGLLEEFKKQGIDIFATFPSSAVNISGNLTLRSISNNEIEYTYQSTNNIVKTDLNQFSIKVFNNTKDKEVLKKLSSIQSKLEKRLQILNELKKKYENGKARAEVIEVFKREINKISVIAGKILKRVNSDENLLAENSLALQIDNLTATTSRASTVMNKFRFIIEAEPGNTIQGMKTIFKSSVVYLNMNFHSQDSANESDNEEDEYYYVNFLFNSVEVDSKKIAGSGKNVNISTQYESPRLNPNDANLFSVGLYHSKENEKLKRIGYLNYHLLVNTDTVKPLWLAQSVPNSEDQYVQTIRSVSLTGSDAFGRIDPNSFSAILTGTSESGSLINKDLSNVLSATKTGGGWSYTWFGDLNPLAEGDYIFSASVKDLAGNGSDSYAVPFKIDRTSPVISLGAEEGALTKLFNIDIPVKIIDKSPTFTDIYVNDVLFFSTSSKEFAASVTLNLEGSNIVKIVSTDAAGNKSTPVQKTIFRDTTPPQLGQLVPADGSTIYNYQFPVTGISNEKLSAASVDTIDLSLAGDKMSFSGTYLSSRAGAQVLNFSATDLAGNTAQISINIKIEPKLLTPELITIFPDNDGVHLFVKGSAGAVRSGAEVSLSAGTFSFNRDTQSSNADGSFLSRLNLFSQIKITATDLKTGEQASATLSYTAMTKISGTVKDSEGVPLPGATVFIQGAQTSVNTDGQGLFTFDTDRTGDQLLVIDGSTIPQSATGPNRKFSKSNIAVNIGVGQTNTLERPIYLVPLLLDGSESPVIPSQATVVINNNAPGVQLDIPANKTVFPDGTGSGSIGMMTIKSEVSTVPVPPMAVPEKVVALEPSGLSFSEPVSLTLPNDNELPAGVRFLIFSMNSKKGIWEVDGEAEVSSDGQSIKTLPGKGISHFSLVYAAPMKPLIREVKNPSLIGVDVSQGSLTTSIDLPSFKALGQNISPRLVYKSNWANPTAYVSNLFDIPVSETQINTTITQKYDTAQSLTVCMKLLGWEVSATCDAQDYLTRVQFDTTLDGKSWYVPESIRAQFFVSNLASNQAIITNESSSGTNNLASLPGARFADSKQSEIVSMQGIPSRSLMSFSVPLRDESGNYLKSGLYPTMTRYEIRLKHMVLYTSTTQKTVTQWRTDNGLEVVSGPQTEISKPEDHDESRVLQALTPEDVLSNIALVSKVDSPYGRGWNFGLTQRIINPDSNRIVIEEASGDLSSYAIHNTISTLSDLNSHGIDTESAMDLSQWPKVVGLKRTQNIYARMVSLDLTNNSVMDLGNIEESQGVIGNQGFHTCKTTGKNSTFLSSKHPYIVKAQLGGVITTANGEVYALNSAEHNLFNLSGGIYSKKFGTIGQMNIRTNLNTFPIANINSTSHTMSFYKQISMGQTDLYNWCRNNLGFGCSSSLSTVRSCSTNCLTATGSDFCSDMYTGSPHGPYLPESTSGTYGISNSAIDGYWDGVYSSYCSFWSCSKTYYYEVLGFNNPKSIVIAPNGKLIVADSGNNVVRSFDFTNRESEKIAGNGYNYFYSPNSGGATQTGLVHPQGLAYDIEGNLYISSEAGYIHKLTPQGNLSVFAGLPVINGGTISDEAHASVMAFSNPNGMVVDNTNKFLYVADTGNHRLVRIDMNTMVATTVAGNRTCDSLAADSVPAIDSSICSPSQIGLDNNNNLIVVDAGHKKIRRVIFNAISSGALSYSPTSKDLSKLVRNDNGTWTRTYRNGTAVQFNQKGLQISSQDRAGLSATYTYDSSDRLTQIQDAAGQLSQLEYSGNKLLRFRDPASRVTTFSYSGDLLKSVSYPDGSSRSFEYDGNGQMIRESNQRGLASEYTYNQYNRLAKVIDAQKNEIQVTDMQTQSMTSSYVGGSVGQLQGSGVGPTKIHDTLIDARSITTEIAKDFQGFIAEIKDGKGQVTKIKRDIEGKPIHIIYPDNTSLSFKYDPNTKDLLSTTDESLGLTESQSYDAYGNVLTKTDGNGLVYRKNYNSLGLVTSEVSPANSAVEYTYYANGLMKTRTIHPTAQTALVTTYEYDQKGNVSKIILPDGKTSEFFYDLSGNLIKKNSGGFITQYEYDLFNRLVKVTTPNTEITTYEYLLTGELSKVVDPKGKIRLFEYDYKGRLIKKTEPNGEIYQLSYDAGGNLAKEIDPNGNVKTYAYDELNRLVQAQFPDDLIGYTYDIRGQVTQAINSNSDISFVRDSKGRVLRTMTAGRGTLSNYPAVELAMNYDNNGNRTSVNAGVMEISYQYDILNRLTQISNSSGDVFGFNYDLSNRLMQISRPGSITNLSYLNSGPLSEIRHSSNGVTKAFSQYQYDARSLPIQKRNVAGTTDYSYDGNGQLTNVSGLNPESFVYDSIGNRVTDQDGSYSYDSNGQKLEQDYQYLYTYDNNGNLTAKASKDANKNSFNYIYSSKNQLTQVVVYQGIMGPIQKQIYYYYDILGRRMQKEVVDKVDSNKSYTRKYVYDGDNIILEYNENNNILAKYTHSPLSPDDILEAEITTEGADAKLAQSSGKYYYLKDILGSITDVADGSGNILQKYEYSSFGKVLSIKNSSDFDISLNPVLNTSYTYTGREHESETGLYYYRARYYDPNTGRFLQQDPDPGKLRSPATVINRYIYVQNNPAAYIDPSGRFPWLVIALVSFAITAYQNNQHGGNFVAQFAMNFAFSSLVYLIGVGLGGAEYSTAATWQQSAWAATQSLAVSSGVKAVAWEAQDRGIASDGTIFALALFAGSSQNYDYKSDLSWSSIGKAVGDTLTYKSPVVEPSSQVPDSGGATNEKK